MSAVLRLAEQLCTRLCHDLTGPIGAVNNGAEFLAEEGFNLQSQAVELITSSAFSAVARLQFYRVAYGRVKEHGEASIADHQRLAQDFFLDSKITLVWHDQYTDAAGVSFSQRMIRLLFNLLIIASSALLKGGKIEVKLETHGDNHTVIEINATGDAVKWEREMEQLLTEEIDVSQVTPKNVQLYLTRQLAEDVVADLSFSADATSLKLRADRAPAPLLPPA